MTPSAGNYIGDSQGHHQTRGQGDHQAEDSDACDDGRAALKKKQASQEQQPISPKNKPDPGQAFILHKLPTLVGPLSIGHQFEPR